jgi:4-hydroxybenzoate polyprenyltransferase
MSKKKSSQHKTNKINSKKSTSQKAITSKNTFTPKLEKTNFTLAQKLLGLAELGRPIEWSKTLLNMVLATLIVYYIYNTQINPVVFVTGFFSVALLWSGLYALNDYTDRRIDALHERKKLRPIPSGKVSPKLGLFFSLALLVISFGIAFALGNFWLLICLIIMLTNQLLYTTKPYRFKSRKYVDVISGSMINPLFRYISGIVLFVPAIVFFNTFTPLLPIIFVVGIQFSGYSLYRLFSKTHDKKLNMKSSVALLPEKVIKKMSYAVMGIAILSYFALIVNGALFKIKWLGYLPVQYLGAILIVVLFVLLVPSLRHAIISPHKADMKNSYRTLYLMNIAFIVGNAIIFIFFP